ncbi:MAG: hypothetical protein KAT56_06840, partial [Sedimentisphaerales bacterium]|nr:hypothetical protein [Sedimentisphaerales bacterium]
ITPPSSAATTSISHATSPKALPSNNFHPFCEKSCGTFLRSREVFFADEWQPLHSPDKIGTKLDGR